MQAFNKLVKGAGILFFGIVISKILTYVYRILVARMLGSEQYGLLVLGLAIGGIATIVGGLGLNAGTLRYVSFFRGKKQEAKIKGVISSSMKIGLVSSIITGIVLFLLSTILSQHVFNDLRLIPIFKIISFLIPFSVILHI